MNSKNSDSLFTFLAGLLAGAAIGILFAPDKGSNTRNKMTFQLDKYKTLLTDLIEDLSRHDNHPNNGAGESKKVVDETKSKAEQLLADLENLIEQIKHKKEEESHG